MFFFFLSEEQSVPLCGVSPPPGFRAFVQRGPVLMSWNGSLPFEAAITCSIPPPPMNQRFSHFSWREFFFFPSFVPGRPIHFDGFPGQFVVSTYLAEETFLSPRCRPDFGGICGFTSPSFFLVLSRTLFKMRAFDPRCAGMCFLCNCWKAVSCNQSPLSTPTGRRLSPGLGSLFFRLPVFPLIYGPPLSSWKEGAFFGN